MMVARSLRRVVPSGAPKTSVLMERIWVTDSLCHHCILFFVLGGMEGGKGLCESLVRSGQGL